MTESNDEEIDLLVQADFDFDERSERSFFRQSSLSNTYIRDDEFTYTSKNVKILASLRINFGPMNTRSLTYYI